MLGTISTWRFHNLLAKIDQNVWKSVRVALQWELHREIVWKFTKYWRFSLLCLTEAFNSLLVQNFMSFILTIGCNAVAVFCLSHDTFKVFDSHSRDSFSMEHPNGKCVLIEIHTVSNLVEYFQALHGHSPDLTFEMKDIQITISRSRESTNNRHSVGFIEQNSAAEMECIC